jgi:hypothetical protein
MLMESSFYMILISMKILREDFNLLFYIQH